MIKDLQYAFRMILKAPAFTAIAVLTLALGIGANSAIFSVVNAVLLRPLPYPDSEKLILLREKTSTFPNGSVSYPNFLDWREGQRSFTDITLLRRTSVNFALTGGDAAPERMGGAHVTWNFLSLLGMKPKIGRDFAESDDVPNAGKVVLISDSVWRQQFGGRDSVLGTQVMVDGVPREIIGVLPAEVRYPPRRTFVCSTTSADGGVYESSRSQNATASTLQACAPQSSSPRLPNHSNPALPL